MVTYRGLACTTQQGNMRYLATDDDSVAEMATSVHYLVADSYVELQISC